MSVGKFWGSPTGFDGTLQSKYLFPPVDIDGPYGWSS